MQKFRVDITKPGVPQVVHAKQADTARAIQVEIFDGPAAYTPPPGSKAAVFYKTPAGAGNYTARIQMQGNLVTAPLIQQMLGVPGMGVMCLVLLGPDTAQLGIWSMQVDIEAVPGLDAAPAGEWYNALQELAGQTLSNATAAQAAQKAAEDAAASVDPAKYMTVAAYAGQEPGKVNKAAVADKVVSYKTENAVQANPSQKPTTYRRWAIQPEKPGEYILYVSITRGAASTAATPVFIDAGGVGANIWPGQNGGGSCSWPVAVKPQEVGAASTVAVRVLNSDRLTSPMSLKIVMVGPSPAKVVSTQ